MVIKLLLLNLAIFSSIGFAENKYEKARSNAIEYLRDVFEKNSNTELVKQKTKLNMDGYELQIDRMEATQIRAFWFTTASSSGYFLVNIPFIKSHKKNKFSEVITAIVYCGDDTARCLLAKVLPLGQLSTFLYP